MNTISAPENREQTECSNRKKKDEMKKKKQKWDDNLIHN